MTSQLLGDTMAMLGLSTSITAKIDNITPVQPPGTTALMTLLGYGLWIVGFVGVLGILYCCGKVIMAHRHGDAPQAAGQLGWIFAACILATAAPLLVNTFIA